MSILDRAAQLARDVWNRLIPNAVEVFSYDLGVRVTEAQLEEMAWRFTERYHRDYMNEFKVHDACHYLLDAPPTPLGEGLVARFQTQHMIYDTSPFGSLAIILSGRIIRKAAIVKSLDRRIRSLREGFQEKIDQLDSSAAKTLPEERQ